MKNCLKIDMKNLEKSEENKKAIALIKGSIIFGVGDENDFHH